MLEDGATVHGISPPRLDLLLSESYELLHRAYDGITKNEKQIGETFDGLHDTLKGTGDFFKKVILLSDGKPYGERLGTLDPDMDHAVISPFGPVPVGLATLLGAMALVRATRTNRNGHR